MLEKPVSQAQAALHFAGRLIAAHELERKELSHKLHDDIGQRLASLALTLVQSRQQLGATGADAVKGLESASRSVAEICKELHAISHELHSAVLEIAGLAPAIGELCEEARDRHKLDVQLIVRDLPRSLASGHSLALFLVAREALKNAATHSHARRVSVEITGIADRIRLRVADDGIGTDSSRTERGLGLLSMQETMDYIGGTLEFISQVGKGTQVIAEVP